MNPWFDVSSWEDIPISAGMSREFEIFGDARGARIGHCRTARSRCHAHRTRTPGTVVRAGPQGSLAVVVDHPPRQPYPAQCRRVEGRRPSGFFGVARQYHVGAVLLGAAAAGPRRGEAACEPGVPCHPVSVRAPDPRQTGKFPRLQGRAILSVAHQGCRRCRFLHRFGRPRRGADAVLVAGAGLRHRAWLDEGPARRPDDRAGRRCRDGRGQYLRGAAGRLEARSAQHLVGRRLQSPEVSMPSCARVCGKNSNPCSAISVGTWSL